MLWLQIIGWCQGALERTDGRIQTREYAHFPPHCGQHREREPLSHAPEDAHMNKTGCFVALGKQVLPTTPWASPSEDGGQGGFDQTTQTWSASQKATTV